MDTLREAQEVRELIRRCLEGDRAAITRFQQEFGELIYGFPMRAYRTAAEDAGDFYLFAFEDGRIFRRVRTFEGRAPFRAYLLGSVLDHLVLEWKRGQRSLDTVSLEEVGWLSDESPSDADRAQSPDQRVPAPAAPDALQQDEDEGALMDPDLLGEFLQTVDPPKAVVLKLLHVEDCELSPAEIRYVAEVSGRDIAGVVQAVEQLRASVHQREAAARGIDDKLDAVHAWIQLYERRLWRLADELAALPPASLAAARLREEQAELERKIHRRQQQRAKLLTHRQRRKVTAPYKEIAAILNTTVGNVGSQISRLRQELLSRTGSGKATLHHREVGARENHD
ncbi:MAG: polymerase ECF-type sigma factor [Deltaproteobacteria bacterium]|nr:polymerase ECF-type sigma factor [Deltaproteobacteria bacterium]